MQAWKHHWLMGAAAVCLSGLALAANARTTFAPGDGGRESLAWRPPAPGGKPSALPTVLIVPGSFSAERIADGCWAQLYDDTHFKGTQLNIIGPVELRTMEGPFGAEWRGLKSAVVGLRAQVIAFDDEDFKDQSLVLEPDQHVPDLRERRGRSWLSWFESIRSLRVLCLPYR